jgi:hypothetical protein
MPQRIHHRPLFPPILTKGYVNVVTQYHGGNMGLGYSYGGNLRQGREEERKKRTNCILDLRHPLGQSIGYPESEL